MAKQLLVNIDLIVNLIVLFGLSVYVSYISHKPARGQISESDFYQNDFRFNRQSTR